MAALQLLMSSLTPRGRLLFLENEKVGLPTLCREVGLNVQFDTEGGFDVGIITRRNVGKSSVKKAGGKGKARGPSEAAVAAMAAKGGFGSRVAANRGAKAGKKKGVSKAAVEPSARPKANQRSIGNEAAERAAA
eukprot:CAMPEP_0174756908 /NCGR_PEP_ID=MMETSP1094-20130205/106996_1 /TAXON_ID=156173 /ORGANISM="Chrysochromulina brevifilum, Strain UTEX LB 985" /LENGTH=133 /DNA_ID=CAMNT_0015962823 /DNA_START=509 /DNA_END=907 /DNA_ORIENTATION=-